MPTIQFAIALADSALQEIIIAQLADKEVLGFDQTADTLLVLIDEQSKDLAEVDQFLQQLTYQVTRTSIEDQNWNALWESNFSPVEIDDWVRIKAHFHPHKTGFAHELTITPKMSFGTGHHATTTLMMQAMKGLQMQGKAVLDFGAGTGILAILANKMGADWVDAIEIEPWSVENIEENMRHNHCSHIAAIEGSSIPNKKLYDVILANITRNVILEHLSAMCAALPKNGVLLLSGLMPDDAPIIRAAAETLPFRFVAQTELNNWVCQQFCKN